jgi:hypothetical protein
MKKYSITLLAALLFTLAAHGADNECGGKPFQKIVGVSAATEQDALNDSRKVAQLKRRSACGAIGGTVTYCGTYEYHFADGIHFVTANYYYTCPF